MNLSAIPAIIFNKLNRSGDYHQRSFTLIELLIAISVLSILTVAIAVVLNPGEFLKQARDSRRLSELQTINSALNLYVANNGSTFGASSTIYISLPDPNLSGNSTSTCPNMNLPPLPPNWQYQCVSNDNLRKVDGTGWLPTNFASTISESPLAVLPIDPINTTDGNLYYTYITGGSWALSALLESDKKRDAAISDGGSSIGVFEVGTNLKLTPPTRDFGLIGFWRFEEANWINDCLALTAQDSSGNNNHAKSCPANTGPLGGASGNGSFDGSDDYLNAGDAATLNFASTNDYTLMAWIKVNNLTGSGGIIDKGTLTANGYGIHLSPFSPYNRINFGYHGVGNFDSLSTLNNGIWYHIAGVRKTGTNASAIYINGTLDKIGTINNTLASTGLSLQIGKLASSLSLNGIIDEARIYNRALSSLEIQTIYNAAQ